MSIQEGKGTGSAEPIVPKSVMAALLGCRLGSFTIEPKKEIHRINLYNCNDGLGYCLGDPGKTPIERLLIDEANSAVVADILFKTSQLNEDVLNTAAVHALCGLINWSTTPKNRPLLFKVNKGTILHKQDIALTPEGKILRVFLKQGPHPSMSGPPGAQCAFAVIASVTGKIISKGYNGPSISDRCIRMNLMVKSG